jgi:IS30 family transposase
MEVGVSQPVSPRWFRVSGGMAPSHMSQSSKPLSGRILSMVEQEEIALLRTQGAGVREVARRLGRAPSTMAYDRAVPGHWEGDLVLGLNRSAIGTLVKRTTRFTMLLHPPPMEGYGAGPCEGNGPALAGHGAEAVRDAITTLPEELRRTLTWDQGAEMAHQATLRIDTSLQVYFCDPHSPWQRGTNENTNGLLRQYFPKGTDLGAHSLDDLTAVAAALNGRPRKTLGWQTPAKALDAVLRSVQSDAAMSSSN